MKKTVLEYTTNTYQEDIPKQFLQEAKIRLNSFFSEQECVQKKGIQFIFKYAFYSVENPRKVTKQHLIKEYARLPLEKRSVQPEQIPDMKQYNDIILYGDNNSPETQKLLAEYLQQHDSLKVLLSFFDKKNDSTYKDEQTIAYAGIILLQKKENTTSIRFHKRHDKRYPFFQFARGEPYRFQMY